MVDAGVRAEMILSRLEGYHELEDEDEGEETREPDNPPSDNQQDGVTSSNYLSSTLSLNDGRLLDEQKKWCHDGLGKWNHAAIC